MNKNKKFLSKKDELLVKETSKEAIRVINKLPSVGLKASALKAMVESFQYSFKMIVITPEEAEIMQAEIEGEK